MHASPHSKRASDIETEPTGHAVVSQRASRGAAFLAAIGILSLWRLRSTGESQMWIGIEFGVAFTFATILFFISRRKTNRAKNLTWLLAGCSIVWPWIMKQIVLCFENGAGFEILLLTSLANASLIMVALTSRSRIINLSVVASGFNTLFVTSISDHRVAVGFAIAWAVYCLWWLIAGHWERLETSPVIVSERNIAIRPLSAALGVALFLFTGWLVSQRVTESGKLMWELMPTSGGTKLADPAARSGVNDGDALVAAKEHATAFGPVDSDLFLETKENSLFDLFSDTFGEPAKKSRREKAIALTPQTMQEEQCEQRAAESQQSSQNLSTQRKTPRPRHSRDRRSDAVVYWIGRTGIRLAVERFDRFDGVEWSLSNASPVDDIQERFSGDSKWFCRSHQFNANDSLYVGGRREAIKFINFSSPRIPVPASNYLWAIDSVDRADFFEVTTDGSLAMSDREKVPADTVVHLVNREIDRAELDVRQFAEPVKETRLAHKSIEELAKQFDRYQRGWTQIESVVNFMRDNYTLRRDIDTSEMPDPLGEFLSARSGNDIMFATATAELLRQLGYQTRFVSGFYVSPESYNVIAGQTTVLPEHSHAWLEVAVSDGSWIPLEPTPGFLPPQYHVSWMYRAKQAMPFLVISLLGISSFLGLIYWLRGWLLELVSSIARIASRWLSDRQRVVVWLWLLDTKAKLAGVPRPRSVAPRTWYVQRFAGNTAWNSDLKMLFDDADRLWFGEVPTMRDAARESLERLWATIKHGHLSAMSLSLGESRPLRAGEGR